MSKWHPTLDFNYEILQNLNLISQIKKIPNPHNINLSLKVNGIEKQNSNTKFLLFNINDLIEDLSIVFTLEPGDIIATGTPSGVGAGRNPQEWLYDSDVIEATVEGIGTIVNTVREI